MWSRHWGFLIRWQQRSKGTSAEGVTLLDKKASEFQKEADSSSVSTPGESQMVGKGGSDYKVEERRIKKKGDEKGKEKENVG